MLDEAITNESADNEPGADEHAVETDEGSSPVAKSSGNMARIVAYSVFLLIVLLIGMDIFARRSHGQSIGALERAFGKNPGKLKLSEAKKSVSGIWSVEVLTRKDGPRGAKSRFAVFRWWCLFGDYWLELAVADGEDPLVLSQPYVSFKKTYRVFQPEAKPDPLPLQIMMLDHEEDSVGSNRVERFQVERAIKENRAKQELLDYFDRIDVDGDGVVTSGEVTQAEAAEGRSPE